MSRPPMTSRTAKHCFASCNGLLDETETRGAMLRAPLLRRRAEIRIHAHLIRREPEREVA
jgi:hypothetical protein